MSEKTSCGSITAVLAGVTLMCASPVQAALVLTEIMFDPAGGNEHEYVEIYNDGPAAVDLTGYQLKDEGGTTAVLPSSSIPAGGTAVIIRIDTSRTLANYQSAWGTDINWIETPFNTWPNYTNTGDHVVLTDDLDNVIFDVAYGPAAGTPAGNDSASIYLTDVTADPNDGSNWALSEVGVDGARLGNAPRTADVGSPGVVPVIPEPAGALGLLVVTPLLLRRHRSLMR